MKGITPLFKKMLAIDSFWERKGHFFLSVVGPNELIMLQGKAPHPRVFGQHKLALMEEKEMREL